MTPTAQHQVRWPRRLTAVAALLVIGIPLSTRPTRVWWWAGIRGLTVICLAEVLDRWSVHHRFDPFALVLPGLALAALLNRPTRLLVAGYEEAHRSGAARRRAPRPTG